MRRDDRTGRGRYRRRVEHRDGLRRRDAIEDGRFDHVRMTAHEVERVACAVGAGEEHDAMVAERPDDVADVLERGERREVLRIDAATAQGTGGGGDGIAKHRDRGRARIARRDRHGAEVGRRTPFGRRDPPPIERNDWPLAEHHLPQRRLQERLLCRLDRRLARSAGEKHDRRSVRRGAPIDDDRQHHRREVRRTRLRSILRHRYRAAPDGITGNAVERTELGGARLRDERRLLRGTG